MNEYVIHAKVKNNLLLSRILAVAKNVRRFCEENMISPQIVGALINMKARAMSASGEWSPSALKLADIFQCLPEDLFTEEQRVAELKSNEAFIEMTREQALCLTDPIKQIESKELVRKLMERAKLGERDRLILKLRYTDELSRVETAEKLDISEERVRQIEARSLRKLREKVKLCV